MENSVPWHHKVPTEAEYTLALQEFERAEAELKAHGL